MALKKISLQDARAIAEDKGLKPGKVRTTGTAVQFTRGGQKNVEIITWDEFEDHLRLRGLAVFERGGWMKIMKDDD